MSVKDLNELIFDGSSILDHVLSQEEIIGMDPNLENFTADDNNVQQKENSQIIQNLENEEDKEYNDDGKSHLENHKEMNEEVYSYNENYYFHQYKNLLSEISDLKYLVENYQKQIEDLQLSSENYFAYNSVLKTKVEEKSKSFSNLEKEIKLKNENIKSLEENLRKVNLLLEDKQKIIIQITNDREAEKSKFELIMTVLVEKLKFSDDKEIIKLLEIPNFSNETISEHISRNFKKITDEKINYEEKANSTLMKENSLLVEENKKLLEKTIKLEKKITEQEISQNYVEEVIENNCILRNKQRSHSQILTNEKSKILNTKENQIQYQEQTHIKEKEILKESFNKKIEESEAELENYKKFNKLLDFKKSFKEFLKKVKLYFVDYEYLIDKRIIGNILIKYFQKSTNKKIKKPLLETLSNMMDFDNNIRKILGIPSLELSNKTQEKLDSCREQLNDIDEMMERIRELNNMMENLK